MDTFIISITLLTFATSDIFQS